MKTFIRLALVVCLFHFSSAYGQFENCYLKDPALKGKIKRVEYHNFFADENGEPYEMEPWNIELIAALTTIKGDYVEFDRQGNVIKEMRYSDKYNFWADVYYTYNHKNQLIKKRFGSDEPCYFCPKYIITYRYDPKGNLIEQIGTSEKKSNISKYVYTYDNDGNKIKTSIEEKYIHPKEGEAKETYSYTYKDNILVAGEAKINKNFSIETESSDIGDAKYRRREYIRDTLKGRKEFTYTYYPAEVLKEEKIINLSPYHSTKTRSDYPNIESVIIKTYREGVKNPSTNIKKYNTNGYLVKNSFFDENNQPTLEEKFVYNHRNDILQKTTYNKKQLVKQEMFSYNERSLPTQIKTLDGKGKMVFFRNISYVYDKNEVVIQEKHTDENDKLIVLFKIEVTYYR